MPKSPERRYWDSDCFLGWLEQENDKAEACKQVLELSKRGKIEIVTSALTLAEVLRMRGHARITLERRTTVREFFGRRYIIVIPILREIAERSQDLVWDHGIKPKDALHVASAISAGLKLFNTFDIDLISKSGTIGGSVLVIEKPNAWELNV